MAEATSDGISWGAISENALGLGSVIPSSASITSVGSTLIDAYLQAMEQAGVMKTLAEPTLTAVSGEQATFRVGGEFNRAEQRQQRAKRRQPDGAAHAIRIEKIEYGIGLEFKPVVLSAGTYQPEDPHLGLGADQRSRSLASPTLPEA